MKHFAVIGDVHGESKLLQELLDLIYDEYGRDIGIYQLGDLVDRGPNVKETIQICIDNNIHSQMGNHEQWIEDLFVYERISPGIFNAAMSPFSTFKSYGVNLNVTGISSKNTKAELIFKEFQDNMPEPHRQFFLDLPYYRVVKAGGEKYYLIHAGINEVSYQDFARFHPNKSEEEVLEQIELNAGHVLLWPTPAYSPNGLHDFSDGIQVFGHKPFTEVKFGSNYIGVDTGCGFPDGRLSAVILPDRKVLSVPKKKESILI